MEILLRPNVLMFVAYFDLHVFTRCSAKKNCSIECYCGNICSRLVICIGFGPIQEAASGFFDCN
jgi:hypothetical protein